MYYIDKLPNVIEIGRVGEKNFREVQIDMSAWLADLPEGIPSIVVIRPGDSPDDAYIAATTFDNPVLTWVVSESDTGTSEGTGSIQIWLEELDTETQTVNKRGKSAIVAVRIDESIDNPSSDVPAPASSWVEQVTAIGIQVTNDKNATLSAKTDAQTAQTAAETAQGKAEDAQTAAETAQGKAEDAQLAAETAQGYAETAQTNAETAAESAASSAESAAAAAATLIDDTSGDGVTNKVWSANKTYNGLAGKADLVGGKVPADQLPSYVDDVVEYASLSAFPITGDAGKIYVALDTDKTYRWSGTEYICIGGGLELGETSENAYRGDRGKIAYDHASDANKTTTAQNSGLYKVGITSEGHISSASAVQKSDITALGIPSENTTYTQFTGATTSAAGTTGLVPAPSALSSNAPHKFLCADGTWTEEETGKLIVKELDTVTNTSGSYTHTTMIQDVTEDMKAVMIEVSDPDAFGGAINISTADGSITLSCDEVSGTSDVTVSLMFVANADTLTSSEFDILANRITELESVGVDIPMTIETTDWSLDTDHYKYDWIDNNNRVTSNCRIKVEFASGAENTKPYYLGYEKINSGVRFTYPTLPTEDIPVVVTILATKQGANLQIYGDEVATDVITGATNVDEALTALNEQIGEFEPTIIPLTCPVGLNAAQWYAVRIGNIVIATGYLAFSSTVSANTVILKGLPKAAFGYVRIPAKANGTQAVSLIVSSSNGDVITENQISNGGSNAICFNIVYVVG